MDEPPLIVLVTTRNREEAEKIARILLEEKLIACANILGPLQSLFWWSGKIEEATENLLIIKTRADLFEKLSEIIKAQHSYEIPEILAITIHDGYKPYLNWLNNSLK
ncbi:MAG: divalent-cation tolerance protein CutA [Candidatus Bathyarchaeia archaeon]